MDISQQSLEIAAKKHIYCDLCHHSFNETPYQYPDDSFDAITCVGALTYCEDFQKVFAEWTRISRPGAVLVMTHRADMMPKEQAHFKEMEDTAKWEKLDHSKGLYLPGNSNYGEDILVEYHVVRNIKK